MQPNEAVDFERSLAQYYADYGRHDMFWRQPGPDGSFDAYKILVSELMLQQTQVSRVTPKYVVFLESFPTVTSLAAAPLGEVLQLWSGLGYNRRAKYLWQAAQVVVDDFGGVFPQTLADLQRLPGVGPNTAGAIMAYAFNQPVVFVETNIRTVIIHHFFRDETGISDAAIKDILTSVMQDLAADGDNECLTPREFYWAMMDYGSFLKKTVGNLNRDSKSFVKQSAFHGSRRQVRGQVIRLLTERPYAQKELLRQLVDDRAESVIADLLSEGLILRSGELLMVG